MNERTPSQKQYFMCHCSGTSQEKIEALVDAGSGDLDTISRLTGASLGCGTCETVISEFLTEYMRSKRAPAVER